MPVRNQNWYDLQEGRRYPLDDRSTGVDDSGNLLRDNIIVDCHIKFPEEYGTYAYISGLTVSGNIVTAVIAAADDLAGTNATALAAITIQKPIMLSKNYAISPIVAGVAGWIVFGSGCAENFFGKYSSPQQTLIAARNARPYQRLPVVSIGKYGLPTTLQDIVKINADPPVTATYTTVTIDNKPAKAIVLALRGQFDDAVEQPLKEYLGPCGARPESGTCPKEPILTINGIKPDCAGNIDIAVGDGLLSYMFDGCGGMGIDFGIGLNEFCPKDTVNPDCTRTGGPPIGGTDGCESSSSSTSTNPAQSSSASGTSSSSAGGQQSSSSSSTPCLTLPYCKNFYTYPDSAVSAPFGTFTVETKTTELGCPASSSSSSSSSSSVPGPPARNVIRTASVTGFNVLTIKNCATDWAINQKISATLQIGGGSRRNGGVVVNYLTAAQTGGNPTFLAALLDLDSSTFRLIRYNGTSVVNEFSETFSSAGFVYNPDKWYTISITPTLFNSSIVLNGELKEAGTTLSLMSFNVATTNYGMVAGSAGIISNQSYTYFTHLTIGE